MTRSSRLLQIIAISLVLAYGGAMFYVLFLSHLLYVPVQSLPLIFWIFVLSFPLLSLSSLLFTPLLLSRRLGAIPRPQNEGDTALVSMSGALILIVAIVSGL